MPRERENDLLKRIEYFQMGLWEFRRW